PRSPTATEADKTETPGQRAATRGEAGRSIGHRGTQLVGAGGAGAARAVPCVVRGRRGTGGGARGRRRETRRRAAASALRVRNLPGARPRAVPPALEIRTVHADDPALLGVLERGSGEVAGGHHDGH